MGLRWQRYGKAAILADGSEGVFNIYEGIILWDGQPLVIDIDEIDADALIGMSLMCGYELVLPVFAVRDLPCKLSQTAAGSRSACKTK